MRGLSKRNASGTTVPLADYGDGGEIMKEFEEPVAGSTRPPQKLGYSNLALGIAPISVCHSDPVPFAGGLSNRARYRSIPDPALPLSERLLYKVMG